jgi:hypothetical protein
MRKESIHIANWGQEPYGKDLFYTEFEKKEEYVNEGSSSIR